MHTHRRIGVNGAYHAVCQTATGGRAVEEYGVGVVDKDAVGRRRGEHRVDGVEASEEASFRSPGHLVGYAWETVFCADDTVITRVEGEFNCLFAG